MRDAITLAADRAGLARLDRAAALLEDLSHHIRIAGACSDLCAWPAIAERYQALRLAVDLRRRFIRACIEQEEARRREPAL